MSDAAIYDEALRADHDRALTALFLPPGRRVPALALLLFNAELARIPAIVNDPTAGLFRFQHWRDTVLGSAARTHGWPALLRSAIDTGQFNPAAIEALIDARATLLDGLEGAGLEAVENFVSATAGRLQAMIAGLVSDDEALQARARAAGTAYGLAGIWPALAAQLRSGRLQLPPDLVQDAGLRQGAAMDGETDRRLAAAIAPLLGRACAHADFALASRSPRALFGVLALARVARWHCRSIAARPESVLAAGELATPPWLAPWLACRRLVNRP